MERWVKSASGEGGQAQKPSVTHAQTIARRARQAATTKAGRKAALADRRQAMGRRGARLSITAMQGPRDRDYRRLRTVAVDLDPDQLERMIDAYEAGGDDFVAKPFDPREAAQKASICIRHHRKAVHSEVMRKSAESVAMNAITSLGDGVVGLEHRLDGRTDLLDIVEGVEDSEDVDAGAGRLGDERVRDGQGVGRVPDGVAAAQQHLEPDAPQTTVKGDGEGEQ